MKIFRQKTKIFAPMILFLLVMPLAFTQGVYAAKKVNCDDQSGVNKTICEASLQKCGDTDSDSDKACRKGFREGAQASGGDSKSDACKPYNGKNETECKNGYDSGKSQRDALNGTAGSASRPIPGSVGTHQCGTDDNKVMTKINFGCVGGDYEKQGKSIGTIEDFFYAIIRFLSNGVGIMMVIALVGAGIQYTTSEGNAEQTIKAKKHIQSVLIALFIYLFTYMILQFLIPGGIFK